MFEIQQIKFLLDSTTFWDSDRYQSNTIDQVGGMQIKVHSEDDGLTSWEVVWPNGRKTTSTESFLSTQLAKDDLRSHLKQERTRLLDETTPKAEVELL